MSLKGEKMYWFLQRINEKPFSVYFGIDEKRKHPKEFKILVQKGILKHVSSLDSVACQLCDDDHESQVRNENGSIFYVCDNGCGRSGLTDDDLAIYQYDQGKLFEIMCEELGIESEGSSPADEGLHVENSFFRIGIYKDKRIQIEVFYLRTNEPHEAASYFNNSAGANKILITNVTKPDIVYGKEGLLYCTLSEIITPLQSKHFFDKKKFVGYLKPTRRVSYNKKEGNLFLDGKRIYTAPLESSEYYFLLFLWNHWEQQLSYANIRKFIVEERGKDTSDPAQKFCQKIKSSIKKSCPEIDSVILIPTVNHYMMADPK